MNSLRIRPVAQVLTHVLPVMAGLTRPSIAARAATDGRLGMAMTLRVQAMTLRVWWPAMTRRL